MSETLSALTFADKLKIAEQMADDGYGWEDIRVKLEFERTKGIRDWLRTLVLKRRIK